MFPSFSSGDNSSNTSSEEKFSRWKGIFTKALIDVQIQVHNTLSSRDDAVEFIEKLMFRLLITLCSAQPHSIEDVDDRISKTFPDPIDKWAIRDAQLAVKDGKKNNILLPVDKIQPLLKEELGFRVDYSLALYIVAVLEYIAADILKISGIYVRNIRHTEITAQDIRVAICADQVLYDMFFQEEDMSVVVEDEPIRMEKMTYEEIVKAIIVDETQYLRDLNMIIRVFRAPFVELFPRSKDLEVIFSNVVDIYDFTAKLLSSVEDQVEMAQDEVPLVGTCFTDLAENEELRVYERYVEDMMAPNGKGRLNALLMRADVTEYLKKAGNGFQEAFKYVLPKLLMGPVNHCLQYFEMIKALIIASPSEEDRIYLEQADALLQAHKALVERPLGNIPKRKNWDLSLRMHAQTRSVTVQKMTEIQKSIEGWDGKDMFQMCSEFIMEGPLTKVIRKTNAERYCFLFDGMILLCKPNLRRMSATGPSSEYKLKEKFFIRKVEVIDKDDTDDVMNAFELHPREQNVSIILQAKSFDEKTNWMAALVSLQTRSMLERCLDSKLREEEKNHPLVPPPADEYVFAVEDSVENIIFEENQESQYESPLIKGGQLFKLVERLTYHMYADPRFLRTFLLTYRSFCSPRELLDLLIKRFDIPEPTLSAAAMADEMAALKFREDLKRFRNKYVKPVQF
ncbi:son of sevenless, partial [Plakobranchus ocellatus]